MARLCLCWGLTGTQWEACQGLPLPHPAHCGSRRGTHPHASTESSAVSDLSQMSVSIHRGKRATEAMPGRKERGESLGGVASLAPASLDPPARQATLGFR